MRKKQLKLAVERRYALADAHYRYCKSLSGVSAAINLFVTRHSSPNAPYCITFPPHSPTKEKKVASNPLFLQQKSSEPTKETIACESCSSSISSVSFEEEREGMREKQEEGNICGYFYLDMPQPQLQTTMVSPQGDFGWDFFNNVVRPEMIHAYNRMSEEEVRAVREQEGIPDLEDEDGERGGETASVKENGGEIEAVKDVRGDEGFTVYKSRAAVKDLYSRIPVAIRSAETISKQIEKLTEEELEPQIRELFQGMTATWKIMLESHEIQSKIIFEVTTFSCPSYGKFCNETHRLTTLQLETELRNWRTCFTEYVFTQKSYVEALFGWLSKFVAPEVEFYSRGRALALPCRRNGPPLLVLCHDWLESMNNLPEKAVSVAIQGCSKDCGADFARELQAADIDLC
ncbi:hypothetical protein SASPL_115009 [Salvia splendens]|uniref:DUF632 domain-containing protein n=1 Tax=Salvia splendens TaxID=180675 RepID=A0A8X8Y7J4_SALSN|nr:hypothetical protein SASPL_115009 [Salvia splendens]